MPIQIPATTLSGPYVTFAQGSLYATGYLLVANGPVDVQIDYGTKTGQAGTTLVPNLSSGQYEFVAPAHNLIIGLKIRPAGGTVSTPAQVVQGQLFEPSIPGLVPVGSGIITASTGATGVTGDIVYSAAATRSGSVICDGSHYNSVSDPSFAALFAAIGTTFGGTGANDFAVPDMRGRLTVAKGTNGNVVSVGQTEPGTALGARAPYHTHTINDPTHAHNVGYGPTSGGGTTGFPAQGDNGVVSNIATAAASTGITAGPAGGYAVDTPAYMVMNAFIVK